MRTLKQFLNHRYRVPGLDHACAAPDPNEPYTKEVNRHIPSGYCVYSKFTYGEVENPLELYRGEDCVEKFCEYIREEAKRLYHMFPEKPIDPQLMSNGKGVGK